MSFADQLSGGKPRPVGPPMQRGLPLGPEVARPQGSGTGVPGGLGGGAGGAGGAPDELAAYRESVAAFASEVTAIQEQLKIVGTARDTAENRHKINDRVKKTQLKMKALMQTTSAMQQSHITGPGAGMRIQQRDRLMQDLVRWGQKFKEVSEAACALEKRPLPPPPALQAARIAAPRSFLAEHEEKQSLLEEERKKQMDELDTQRMFADRINEEREDAIKDIEASMVQVNEMFRDLATIVQEQGIMIDNIEQNIESASVRTRDGVEELHKASQYERKARNKTCIIAVIAVVIFAVVAVVIVVPSVIFTR